MTNLELIKYIQGTQLYAALSHIDLSEPWPDDELLTELVRHLPCRDCRLESKDCSEYGGDCKRLMKDWLNSHVTDIPVMAPKKPKKYIDMAGIERDGCPSCDHNEILYAGQKYCSVCGQQIDWSKEDNAENAK